MRMKTTESPAQVSQASKAGEALAADVRAGGLRAEHQHCQIGEGRKGFQAGIGPRLPAAAMQLLQARELAYQLHACITHHGRLGCRCEVLPWLEQCC